ncbi:MAG: alpha/beta hydrolase [Clostridia bacterium]|nr:alpha/beta hydrolase [Clostridia bacterium]
MKIFFIILAAVAALFLLYVIIGTLIGTKMTIVRHSDEATAKRDKKKPLTKKTEYQQKYKQMKAEGQEWLDKQTFEPLTLKTFDGLTLRGKFYRTENAKATVIFCHGYRSWPEREFMSVVKFYGEHGFNFLFYDRRAHGKSDGKYITFGVLDRYDLRDWIKYIDELCGRKFPIVLDGVSMGASTVCMASSLDLPENVKVMIADCPYTSPKEEIAHTMKTFDNLPVFPLIHTISFASKILAKSGFSDCDAREEIAKTKIPLFLAHGAEDRFVPTYMGKQIYDACNSPKELFIVEDASHGFAYVVATEEYRQKLMKFFKEHGVL